MYIGQLEKEKIPWEKSSLAGLKLSIQKTKTMASGPITSWKIVWENNGNSQRLLFSLAPK